MILGDTEIRSAISRGEIVVRPMAPWAINANSIDLHLAPTLRTYFQVPLCTDRECFTETDRIDPGTGLILKPGQLYLGTTVEWTSSGPYMPVIDGTSGAGRLGISVHQTAGIGDVGFEGHWTLEITVIRPVRIFGGESLAQIRFFEVRGPIRESYQQKRGASYADAAIAGPVPQPSRMWKKRRWLGRSEGEV